MNFRDSSPPYRYKNQTPELLTGVVERITFHAEESGYTVARIQCPRARDLVTVVGSFANIQAGQTLQLKGVWKNHPQYGEQFEVQQYTETKPSTLTGMEKYLGSGLHSPSASPFGIKGVGPVTAKRIVAYFGLETLEVIENEMERLSEVPGIGKKRVSMIKAAWAAQKAIKDVMVFLQGHGVSTTYAVKIFKEYGSRAIAKVTENPYQLADDIHGLGFLTADKIAQNVGVSPWSKYRYRSGFLHVLSQAAEDGHCFLPQPELMKLSAELLSSGGHEADPEAVCAVIEKMGEQKQLVVERAEGGMPLCYKPAFFIQAESSAIIRAAHQINRGQYPDLEAISDKPQSDCLWHNGGTEPEHGVQVICDLLRDFIPRRGFNPATDVQVLCPMVRGAVGTRNLNQVLQKLINPPGPNKAEVARGGMIFRLGDKVIQLRNDYNRQVFNGDLGMVAAIDPVEQELTIRFDGRDVVYDYGDLNEIALAWSISIHKSQGSEYPVVLLPIHKTHYIMLSRNLIYTGLTRAKKLAIVIGSNKAIALAVGQVNQQQRYTRLKERLEAV